ncbi:Pre-mRNA-splicing factor SYF2 [Coemansia guatemalensis]|uniref:Pre-mRNA-splicing factor SYF2 n=1 Tax=Coemansia guatemalensis TaxID=2761395 RepID=A0A9W8I0B8_9FUNG|nr:Pre-mRNA-splicing factor SYF2 [Coemansia guatemalensis]
MSSSDNSISKLEDSSNLESKHEDESHSEAESQNSSQSSDEDDDHIDITLREDIPEQLRPQVDRLKALRARLAGSSQSNKRDIYKEHQRKHENPGEQRRQERKRREALIMKAKEEHSGADYERSRFWDYSIEQVENYEEKKRKREENRERGFTDYAQINQRKYERDVAKLKPDLAAYQRDKAESSTGKALEISEPHKPDTRGLEKLVKSVEDQQKRRATLHKPSVEKEGEDVSYINQRNARFNRKMNRAYDKYTKEIRDSFERGTAL